MIGLRPVQLPFCDSLKNQQMHSRSLHFAAIHGFWIHLQHLKQRFVISPDHTSRHCLMMCPSQATWQVAHRAPVRACMPTDPDVTRVITEGLYSDVTVQGFVTAVPLCVCVAPTFCSMLPPCNRCVHHYNCALVCGA